jgi:hypothetical protein
MSMHPRQTSACIGMRGTGVRAFALALTTGACCLCFADAEAASGLTASTGGASNVTFSSAVLHGSVNPGGAPANFAFQYGTSRHYGAQTPLAVAGSGTSSVRVSEAVHGLRPDTTYHYRLLAFGTTTAAGRDRTFKTAKVPLSLAIAAVPNPVPFGGAFLLEGNLSGTGAAGRRVVVKTNPFPYGGAFKPYGNSQLTSPTGGFSFFIAGLLQNTRLLVATTGKPVITSPVLLESVSVRVAFHVRHTRRAGFVRFYGTVAPAEVGAQVGFQLLRAHHRSVNQGGTAVTPGTPTVARFSRVVHIRHHGLYRALVKISDPSHVSGYSRPILVG